MLQGLITDRTQANVLRRNELAAKGWNNMTAEEQAEWLAVDDGNLLPYGPYYSSSVSLKFYNEAFVARTASEGIYLYAILIIGPAEKFVGKNMTLSAEHIGTADGGNPQMAVYWHDDNGYEYAGASLNTAGSVTFNTGNNPGGRAYLAMYVYVTADKPVSAGAAARFSGVMLGWEAAEYVPHREIKPNDTTKGAYNYSDLNRVERAASELSEVYSLNLETKTDWNMWDVPQESDMRRYILNIKKIRHACLNPNGVSVAPDTMAGLNFNDANNIERILLAASEGTDRVYRCGELSCGEV